jgi:hypothetical protein
MYTFESLTQAEDAAATAVYLVKIGSMIREVSPMHSFLLEHYQHELDLAAIRLAGPKATKSQIREVAEVIKAAIEELEGAGGGAGCPS